MTLREYLKKIIYLSLLVNIILTNSQIDLTPKAYAGFDSIQIIKRVSSLAELKSTPWSSAIETIYVEGREKKGDGYEGIFQKSIVDLTHQVAIDPFAGIYAAPDSAPSGIKGAWVRVHGSNTTNVKWFGATGDGTDESREVQAAINLGQATYFPTPKTYYKFGGISIDTRGQKVTGSGMRKCAVIPIGSNAFYIRENNVEISDFWFRPSNISTPRQDNSNTTNILYIENKEGASKNINGLRLHDNYFQDIAGAALFMKSGLRESYIHNNQFRGMGSVASDLGVIHGAPNADFSDSSNYVYMTENVFYRAETPFIYLKAVLGSNPREHYYDNWFFSGNLFHGQRLNETIAVSDPKGPVVAGPTDMIIIQSFTGMMFDNNTFTSFHGDYHAIHGIALLSNDKNGNIYLRNNRFFVDNNGSYTGSAITLDDCFMNVVTDNTFASGFQTHDIEINYSGTFSFKPVIDVSTNLSSNQYGISISLPESYLLSDYEVRTLKASSVNTKNLSISDHISLKRSGRTTLKSSTTSRTVTWEELGLSNMPNGDYDVYTRVVGQNLAVWVTGITPTGFTINIPSNPSTRTVSWFVIDSTTF